MLRIFIMECKSMPFTIYKSIAQAKLIKPKKLCVYTYSHLLSQIVPYPLKAKSRHTGNS